MDPVVEETCDMKNSNNEKMGYEETVDSKQTTNSGFIVSTIDFASKYAHLEDFFKFESSKGRENGIFDMVFSCVKCLPVVKVLKTTTQAPMSNLRAHLRKIHLDLMDEFDEKTRTSSKRSKKSFKNRIDKRFNQTNENLFEDQDENFGLSDNPWSVTSIYDFSYFVCPECDSKWHFKQDFVDHALSTHPNSIDPLHHEITDGSLNDIDFPNITSLTVDVDIKVEDDSEYLNDFPLGDNDIDFDEEFKNKSDEEIFLAKYKPLENIFKFKTSHSRGNGLFHLTFSCAKCEPEEKLLKTTTPSPLSNLRAHLKKLHPNVIPDFDDLVR